MWEIFPRIRINCAAAFSVVSVGAVPHLWAMRQDGVGLPYFVVGEEGADHPQVGSDGLDGFGFGRVFFDQRLFSGQKIFRMRFPLMEPAA
ncbi:hypothetical protein OH491_00700 [Termitidicoccus mucosus]|uniref:Uncharacterized protein n=1 Tax=Termitidicoccus mucosus TaxID=1184151 RepID=A0A178IAU0_9BACT|nr:hypothetical protein AW736_24675 [Opitutaceae bacterium TSB47]